MRIIHCSDVHLCLLSHPWRLRGKCWAGAANWLFHRVFLHDLLWWDRLAEAMLADPPDLFIHTGDLSQLGTPEELLKGAGLLYRLREAGTRVLFVPGNHDAYRNEAVCSARLRTLTEDFGGDELHADGVSLCRIGELEIILLSQSVPQGWFHSGGIIKEGQWRGLERLSARRPKGFDPHPVKARIVIGHFPLCTAKGELLGFRRRLKDAGRLRLRLQALKANLYLCGHIHHPFTLPLHEGCVQHCAGSVTLNGNYTEILYKDGLLTPMLRRLEAKKVSAESKEGEEGG